LRLVPAGGRVSFVVAEGTGTYACARVNACADKVGVFDGWVTCLVACRGISAALQAGDERTEGKNVEEIVRNPKNRSMRKIKLVLPYTRISNPHPKEIKEDPQVTGVFTSSQTIILSNSPFPSPNRPSITSITCPLAFATNPFHSSDVRLSARSMCPMGTRTTRASLPSGAADGSLRSRSEDV
jgi:hypothetical protein